MNNDVEKKLPKTALSLYVKLFCKKRGNKTKNNKVLIEATKSWLSLNKHEKQQFLKKYNEYLNNIKIASANYLKKAEPFLKVRKKTIVQPDINIIQESTATRNTINEEIEINSYQNQRTLSNDLNRRDQSIDQNQMDPSIDQENLEVNVNSVSLSSPRNELHYDNNIQLLENMNISNRGMVAQEDEFPIVEPTPPKFITGEQLFTMIDENEGNSLTWARLSNAQKRKYQQAVLSIKRKYLKEYKHYLEHLPSEKLFHHYKNNI